MATSSGDHAGTSGSQDLQVDCTPEKKNNNTAAGLVFLALTTVVSGMFGFKGAISMMKKQDPVYYEKGVAGSASQNLHSGTALASRALRWGTLLAFSGVGLISFTIWKLLGVHNMEEFTAAVQAKMPVIPKKDKKDQGRSDFKNLRELVEYIEEQDEINRKKKEEKAQHELNGKSEVESTSEAIS